MNDNDKRSLHRSGEAARPAARRCGKIPGPAEIPAASDDLGRGGDELLLQGEVTHCFERLVRPQPVPVTAREARTGRSYGPDDHPGVELVQE